MTQLALICSAPAPFMNGLLMISPAISRPCLRSYLQFVLFLAVVIPFTSCGGSGTGNGGGIQPPNLTLTVSPQPLYVFPASNFVISVTASSSASTTPTLTAIQLPAGITLVTALPVTIPSSGASLILQTTATLAAGNYILTLSAAAGTATTALNVTATVPTYAPPSFFFPTPLFTELGVPIGGSAQMMFSTIVNSSQGQTPDYTVQLSLSGIPAGTTATVTPTEITPGQSVTVAVTASNNAPTSQNVTATLTGTPSTSAVSPASIKFLVDVSSPPGSLPNNRTDYFSTEGTPYAAVYDSAHGLIFVSNPSWNRIDVISSTTHAEVSQIPIRDPRGIDITQDNSTVWVATGSRQVFALNTSSFAVTRYLLPAGNIGYWEGTLLLALADGTLMIPVNTGPYTEATDLAIWNPANNALTFPRAGIGSDALYRSGNGERVYFIDSSSGGQHFYYDVPTKTFSNPFSVGEYAIAAAVNEDGTRLYMCDAVNGPALYDGNFNLIGPVPACGFGGTGFFEGGSVFSADNRYLYQEGTFGNGLAVIYQIDPNTANILSMAPALPMIPILTELSQIFYLPTPFAVDNTGMVLGIEDFGIAFDDSTYTQNFSPSQPGSPYFMQHMAPYFGPLSGGTASGGFGNAFSLTPDVWYGSNRGTVQNSSGELTITSPSASASGPVNIKMLFADGSEVFNPLFFSYGSDLQYSMISGAPPQGNVAGYVAGYGLPGDNISGTLTVSGTPATLQPPGSNGLLFAGTPFPNKILSYTVPPGGPGFGDIVLSTADGTSTLPKAMYYAQSVNDYPSSDVFTAVLYDATRRQVYLSAGDHIDVFSLSSNQFLSPLTPPSVQGSAKQFAGLALTPDGSMLLAGDVADASLAALNPDNPSQSFAIPVLPVSTNGCNYGPFYIAPTSNNKAFVIANAFLSTSCISLPSLYMADLVARTAGKPPASGNCTLSFTGFPGNVSATQDGTKVAIGGSGDYGGFCVYDVASNSYTSNGVYVEGAAFSGDGNVAAANLVFADSSANTIGRIAQPIALYSGQIVGQQSILPHPQFNGAGSLYYLAYPTYVEIIDVLHSTLRMRFSLSETVSSSIPAPIAVDPDGRYMFLITNKGLTVVDLGQAPLSIGWLNQTSATPGSQVVIRGSGFDSSTTVTIGGQAAAAFVTDADTMTVTIPSVSPGPTTISVTNSTGVQYSMPGLLTIQ